MTTRKAMKGVLDGFLGTYMSRYSHYEGYWLFGFLICDLPCLRVDLLSDGARADETAPEALAIANAGSPAMVREDQVLEFSRTQLLNALGG